MNVWKNRFSEAGSVSVFITLIWCKLFFNELMHEQEKLNYFQNVLKTLLTVV